MNAAATVLRPLTPAETRAVSLHAEDVAMSIITTQTRLTAEQVTVALARQAEWDAIYPCLDLTTAAEVVREHCDGHAAVEEMPR